MGEFAAPIVLGIRYFQSGQHCSDVQPGDLVLVRHTHSIFGRGIRLVERLRKPSSVSRAEWRGYAAWNHAMIGVGDNLVSQEASRGDEFTDLLTYVADDYAVVSIAMTSEQRDGVVAFSKSILGDGYGYFTIPADLFNALTGVELVLGLGNMMVCSTASARALERSSFIPDRSPYAVTPAHLAWYFGVPYNDQVAVVQ